MSTDVRKLKKEIKELFLEEYIAKAKAENPLLVTMARISSISAPVGYAVGLVCALAAPVLLPVVSSIAGILAASAAGFAVCVASVATMMVKKSKVEKKASQSLDLDIMNGVLLKRFQEEILPLKYAKIKEKAKEDAAKRKEKVEELRELSKLAASDLISSFNEKSGRLPDSGVKNLVSFVTKSLPRFGAKK